MVGQQQHAQCLVGTDALQGGGPIPAQLHISRARGVKDGHQYMWKWLLQYRWLLRGAGGAAATAQLQVACLQSFLATPHIPWGQAS
jgi:hypothetical protein